jgi:hypothetical protein
MVEEGKGEGDGRRDGVEKGLFSGLIQGTSLFRIWLSYPVQYAWQEWL